MFDELLGRAELKDRIAELEDERDSLQARLDAESKRRADAVAERQRVEEHRNRLQDRIADLEGQVDRLQETTEADQSVRSRERARGSRLRELLDRVESLRTEPEGVLTAAVGADERPAAVTDAFGARAPLVDQLAPCVVVRDDAGLVSAALAPPRPPAPFATWDDRPRLDRGWFLPEGPYALALVRSDLFAVGVFDGDERVAFEAVESDVMADHSKGGFSQARFERRRDEQIDAHLERCREELDDHAPADAPLYVVGERTVLGEFEDLAAATRTVDARGDPEPALRTAVQEFWTTTVYGV
jgi:peptide subunit release factor 1 (eRF1)